MAGIQGMPSGSNPTDLQSPVPAPAPTLAQFAAQQAPAAAGPSTSGSNGPSLSEFAGKGYTGPGSSALQHIADALPTIGGIAGGIAGIPGDVLSAGLSSVGGAAAGAAGGNSLKRLIEVKVLGKDPGGSAAQEVMGDAKEAAKAGIAQAAGDKLGEAFKYLANTKAGTAVVDGLANAAAKPLAYLRQATNDGIERLTQPVLQMIQGKTSQLNSEQAGDAVKQLFANDIQQRFGKFVNAYGALDKVAQAQPLTDDVRKSFFDKTYNWAIDNLGGDNFRMVKKQLQDLTDADNGKKFGDLIQQLSSKANAFAQDGLRAQAGAVRELRDRAEQFMEDQTMKLAQRVSAGKASMPEMSAFQEMMGQQANPTVPVSAGNLPQYAKSVAKDYLDNKDSVRAAYSKFRGFLEDVGEQTRTNPNGRGPLQFLKDIQDVPSEKLVERMFDPKNAAALRAMQSETPQVFDQVVKSKMTSLVQQSSPTGNLDLQGLQSALNKMPQSTRSMLLTDAEHGMMNRVMNNPALQEMEMAYKHGERGVTGAFARQAMTLGLLGRKAETDLANAAVSSGPVATGVRQAVGRAIVPLVQQQMGQP